MHGSAFSMVWRSMITISSGWGFYRLRLPPWILDHLESVPITQLDFGGEDRVEVRDRLELIYSSGFRCVCIPKDQAKHTMKSMSIVLRCFQIGLARTWNNHEGTPPSRHYRDGDNRSPWATSPEACDSHTPTGIEFYHPDL